MPRVVSFAMLVAIVAAGCSKSESHKPTPEEHRQLEATRQATIDSCEHLLGRKLTESEKACVQVELKDGLPSGSVASPLSDLLKQRQAELNQSHAAGNSGQAAATGMTKYPYVVADGGPHMLLPACVAGNWKGVSSTADVLNPNSDYDRACAATGKAPIAVIPVGVPPRSSLPIRP